MSEDRRKLLRTQGKYSEVLNPNDRSKKARDKGHKNISPSVDSTSKKTPERNSETSRELDSSTDENITSIRYEKNSDFSFSQLDNVKKPIEIKERGPYTLSITENGESKILYEPDFLEEKDADYYYSFLRKNINWDEKNIVIHGVEYPQPRLVTWFGPFPYSYSGTTLEAAEMPPIVKKIKEEVELLLKKCDIDVSFNSVLLNLYRNGKDSVAWHSDDELTMGISPTIASVSLGETRRFEMRPKIQHNEDSSSSDQLGDYLVHLTHGSLVIMTGCMQEDWQHRVPKEYHDKGARINLTFRTVYPLEKIPEHAPVREIKKEKTVSSNCVNQSPGIPFDNEDFPPLDAGSSHLKNNLQKPSLNVKTKDDAHNVSCEYYWDDEISNEEQTFHDSINDSLSKHKNVITSNKFQDHLVKKDSGSFENCSKESMYSPVNVTEENNLDKETPSKWQYAESHSLINTSQGHNFDKKDTSKNFYQEKEKRGDKSYPKYHVNQKNIPKNRHDYKGYCNDAYNGDSSNTENNFSEKLNSHEFNLNIKENNNDFNIKRNSDKYYEENLSDRVTGERKRYSRRENEEGKSGVKGYVKNEHRDMVNSNIKDYPRKEHNEDINSHNYENHKDFRRKDHSKNPRDFKNKSQVEGYKENEDRRRHVKQYHNVVPLSNVNTAEKNEKTESTDECYDRELNSPVDATHNFDRKESPKGLNVEAKEFVPINLASSTAPQQNMHLESLLHYKFDLMEGDSLMRTSFVLRDAVLERLSNCNSFRRHDREELEFLCKITDGSQTEKNQKLISSRMCNMVISALERPPPPRNQRPFYENPRHRDFDSQNHHSDRGKRFQNQSRSYNHRH